MHRAFFAWYDNEFRSVRRVKADSSELTAKAIYLALTWINAYNENWHEWSSGMLALLLGCPLLFYQTRIWVKIKIISVNSMSLNIFLAAKWSSKTCEWLEKKSLSCDNADVLVLRLKWRHIHSRLIDFNLTPSLTEITLTHKTQLQWTNEDKMSCHTKEIIPIRVLCFENAVLKA